MPKTSTGFEATAGKGQTGRLQEDFSQLLELSRSIQAFWNCPGAFWSFLELSFWVQASQGPKMLKINTETTNLKLVSGPGLRRDGMTCSNTVLEAFSLFELLQGQLFILFTYGLQLAGDTAGCRGPRFFNFFP